VARAKVAATPDAAPVDVIAVYPMVGSCGVFVRGWRVCDACLVPRPTACGGHKGF
jgi:hypothetical protein